jgi:hypothetical protein
MALPTPRTPTGVISHSTGRSSMARRASAVSNDQKNERCPLGGAM